MTAEVIYVGPMPPESRIWCFACAYIWKLAVNELHALTIEQAMKAPDDSEPVVINTVQDEGLPPLGVAVATGLFGPLTQFGPLQLCWTHLTPIQLKTASGLHLPAPGMPGMGLNGMAGL